MESLTFCLQALLVRHEAYMADAEQERLRMTASIEKLEQEKRELEEKNAQTIRENRELIDQLEVLNNSVADSDAQVKSLTEALHETQEELQRLMLLTARTESLEAQLAQFEKEQEQLQENLAESTESEKSALLRCRRAERTIADLQDQIDRIEREAREEKERHIEVIGRMERRRAVERELETAAGRLKGAAALKTTANDRSGSNVVSHFVKDILQDNANLQMGILELKEMLSNSNEEVERLREQFSLHQPLDASPGGTRTPTLRAELESGSPKNQALHVHHHYHAASEIKEPKHRHVVHKRVKKKRHVVTPGHFTPPSTYHTPRSSISRINTSAPVPRSGMTSPTSAATILSQTSVTIPNQSKRWSFQSNQTGHSAATSSVPESPYSNSYRTSSMFDRVFSDVAYDSSRPTSPESAAAPSPLFAPIKESEDTFQDASLEPVHKRSNSQGSKLRVEGPLRSFSSPINLLSKATPTTSAVPSNPRQNSDSLLTIHSATATGPPLTHPAIPEENEALSSPSSLTLTSPAEDSISSSTPFNNTDPSFFPTLRRTGSHESLLSISGMDIHLAQSRHSARLPTLASSLASTAVVASTYSLTSSSAVSAVARLRPTADGRPGASARSLLHGVDATRRPRNGPPAVVRKASASALGRVGGWVFGKWGATPAPSSPTKPPDTGSITTRAANGRAGSSITVKRPAPTSAQSTPASGSAAPTPPVEVPRLPGRRANDERRLQQKTPGLGLGLEVPASVPGFRAPGVNQAGPIMGIGPQRRLPVTVVVMDEDGLREELGSEAGAA